MRRIIAKPKSPPGTTEIKKFAFNGAHFAHQGLCVNDCDNRAKGTLPGVEGTSELPGKGVLILPDSLEMIGIMSFANVYCQSWIGGSCSRIILGPNVRTIDIGAFGQN